MIRVLYVDDEEALLDVCKQFLERSGEMVVETTTTTREALQKMSTVAYDAVISDYQMPETNGIDFLKSIRSRDDPIPFILFTGRGREEVVIEALNSGADFYLQKGGDPSSQFKELEHKVKESVRRNRAENALKLNEARLNKAQAIGLTGCWELNLESGPLLLWGSDESFRIFGVPHSNENTVPVSMIEGCIVESDYARQALRDLIDNGAEYNLEYHVIPLDGGPTRIVRSMAELVKDNAGKPVKVVGVIQDISERKRSEAGLRGLNRDLLAIKECNKAMVRARTEQELVSDICKIVCEIAGYRMAWIGMRENDERKSVRPVALSGQKIDIDEIKVTWGDDELRCGTMGTAIKTASTVISRHVQDDPSMTPWKEQLTNLGYRSVIAIPITDSGVAFGAFGIYVDDPEGFRKEQVELLEEMTGDLAFGILGLRTKQRQAKAEEAQRKSEERFRILFSEAPMALCISLEGRVQQCNRRFLDLFDQGKEEGFVDLPLESLVIPRERERLRALTEEGRPGEFLELKTVGIRSDGTEFALYAMFTSVTISDRQASLGFFSDTTEKDRMQAQITESEEKYRMFIERSPLAFALTDASGTIIQVNPAYCELLGCVPGDMIGVRSRELMPPEDQEALRSKLLSLHRNGTESMDCRLIRNDGKLVPVSIFSSTLPDGNTMSFIEDVTNRMDYEEKLKAKEQELVTNEKKFRTIFDRAALGIVTSDLEGRPIDFNQRFVEMIGYSPEEIREKSFLDITHPDDIPHNRELFEAAKNGALDGYDMEKRIVRKDGSVIWIHIFASKLMGSSGRLDRGLTIMEDITERKRLSTSLGKSEEQYAKLVAAIPDIVVRTDMAGNIVMVNDIALDLSGYGKRELLGRSLFSFIAAEDVEKAMKNAQMMVRGKLGPVEYKLILKDGGRALFEINGDVLRDGAGTPTALVFVGRDLTERRQLESKLREANRKLRVMDSITRHDTVNKLMALQGYVDLMRKGRNDVKDAERLDRMDQIVGFLKDQVKVTKEYQNMGVDHPQWQSISEVCLHAASLSNLGGVAFTVDVGDLEILADPLLYKVFYNLIDNAVRHGITVDHIWVSGEQVGEDVRITLKDNGAGIALDAKANLFREGYGKVHGLGLFLSREILDITGITIAETGEPGEGACFEIRVPKNSFRMREGPKADA